MTAAKTISPSTSSDEAKCRKRAMTSSASTGGVAFKSRCDLERVVAFGHVRVDREHAPLDAILANRQLWQRYGEYRRVRAVDVDIAGVHALSAGIEHLKRAERRLERLREDKPDLARRHAGDAADGGRGVIQEGVRPCRPR